MTWRELDDMDFGRRLWLEDLAADLKSFAAACQGVTIQPDALNPIRSAAASRSSVKLKPSQVRPDGHVTR